MGMIFNGIAIAPARIGLQDGGDPGGGDGPSAPSNLVATAYDGTTIDLAWTDNSDDETGFKIERGTDGVAFSQIDTVGAEVEGYEDTGLTPGQIYYYRVRATNAEGDSDYSNTDSDTTPDLLHQSTFTAADGTALTAYTPDTGNAWTQHVAGFSVLSNQLDDTGSNTTPLATTETNEADVIVSVDITPSFDNNTAVGIILRFTDTNNYWRLAIAPANNEITIFERTSGTWTERASASVTIAASTTYTLLARAIGTRISLEVNGVGISYESSSHQTATSHGIVGRNSGSTFDFKFDNFEVYDASALTIPTPVFTDGVELGAHTMNWPTVEHVAGQSNTYLAYAGPDADAFAMGYNHSTEAWSAATKVGDTLVSGDSHGYPSIIRSGSGKLHVHYGTHSNQTQYGRSTNADDTSAWDDQGGHGSSTASYSQAFIDAAGAIYTIMRNSNTGGVIYNKSSDDGDTWSSGTLFDDDVSVIYWRSLYESGTPEKVHFAWTNFVGSNDRRHMYYAYWNLDDGNFYNIEDTSLGSTVTASEFASCLVFDSSTERTNIPALRILSGVPYIMFNHNDAGTIRAKMTWWNGGAWETPETIAEVGQIDNIGDFIVTAADDIEAYLVVNDEAVRGGRIEQWVKNGVGWEQSRIVIRPPLYGNMEAPRYIESYTAGTRVFFGGAYTGSAVTGKHGFVYGKGGYIS